MRELFFVILRALIAGAVTLALMYLKQRIEIGLYGISQHSIVDSFLINFVSIFVARTILRIDE